MQISWWTLVIQGINFLVLVWLLQRFLYKPVQDVIEKRRQLGLAAACEAERAKTNADAAQQRYQQALDGIETERRAALETARSEIATERSKVLEEARIAGERDRADAKKAIEQERVSAREALKAETIDLAVRLAGTLLADFADEIPSATVLSRLETELASLPPAERERLKQEVGANGAEVEIVTAHALSSNEQSEWRGRIEKALGQPIQATFGCDPDIIAGCALRLPHTVIRATWAEQLSSARQALLRGEDG
jgi:F-type H+-transporting ATPase subunit b